MLPGGNSAEASLGWLKCGNGGRLALEARQSLGQELQRHLAVELGVAGDEHLAHAATAELAHDLIVRQSCSDHREPSVVASIKTTS